MKDATFEDAVDRLVRVLGIPGTLVNEHPEALVETSAELISLELHHIATAIERVGEMLGEIVEARRKERS